MTTRTDTEAFLQHMTRAARDRAFVTGAEVDRLRGLAGFTTPAMSSTWTGTVDPDNVAWMAERARKPARVAG